MATYNPLEEARLNSTRQVTTPDYDMWDGMAASAAETARSLPIASLARGLNSWTDSSEEITAEEANLEFGFEGEAAYPEGTKITKADAIARAEDRSAMAQNEMIMGVVNEESPILGALTQFGAGMAAGLVDPVSMGIGVGVNVGLAKGIARFAAGSIGRAANNRLLSAAPKLGQMMLRASDDTLAARTTDYLLKEGSENFLASVAEETINFANIGEDRLARKVTASESLANIVIGTTFGTGLGMALNGEARKAIGKSLSRKYGDSAADTLGGELHIKNVETQLGIKEDGIHNQMLDEDDFDAQDYHQESGDTLDTSHDHTQGKHYIPLDEDGELHLVSERGQGIVFTNNVHHAQNKGSKVREVDLNDHKIMTVEDLHANEEMKSDFSSELVDDLLNGATDEQLARIITKQLDPEGEVPFEKINFSEIPEDMVEDLAHVLKEQLFNAYDLDEMFDILDVVSSTGRKDFDAHKTVDNVLSTYEFDGYSFNGKRRNGGHAYTGVYVNPESLGKAGTVKEWDSVPDNVAKETKKIKDKARLEKYHASLQGRLADLKKSEEAIVTDNEIKSKDKKEIVDPETGEIIEVSAGNEASEYYNTNAHQRTAMDKYFEKLNTIKNSKKGLSPEELKDYQDLEAVMSGKDVEGSAEETIEALKNFQDCMINGVKEVVDGE